MPLGPVKVGSEPVRNIRDAATSNLTLVEIDASGGELETVPVVLSGVDPDGLPVDQITTASHAVTSVTVQPLAGLKYGTSYRLKLGAAIADLDPDPKSLVAYESDFTTFGPVGIGESKEQAGSAGIVVMGERAYLTRTNAFVNTNVLVYDVADPVEPVQVGESQILAPVPYDIVGEDQGEKLVAVALGSGSRSKPASVAFFDVTTDDPLLVGVSTVADSAFDGYISRIALKGGLLFSATVRKGIQAIDVSQARQAWGALGGDAFKQQQALAKVNKDGEGFGQEAVVLTIPLAPKENGTHYWLADIKAGEFQGQTLAVVTGEPGLLVASPAMASLIYQGAPQAADGFKLVWGQALALGRLSDQDVAVVVTRTHLVTVSLVEPTLPTILGYVSLTQALEGLTAVDVILRGDVALVGAQAQGLGAVIAVNLTDLSHPVTSGRLQGIGGRLALGANNLLFSTARRPTGGMDPLGGVRTATLGVIGAIPPPRPTISRPVALASGTQQEEETTREISIRLDVYPRETDVKAARLEIANDGVLAQAADVAMSGGQGTYRVEKGFRRKLDAVTTAEMRFFQEDGTEVKSARRKVDIGRILLRVDSNNDTIVAAEGTPTDKKDDEAWSDGEAFSFWESRIDQMSLPGDLHAWENALTDFATLSVRLRAPLAADEKIGLRMSNSRWQIARKVTPTELGRTIPLSPQPDTQCVADRKLHLCHAPTAEYQARTVLSSLPSGIPGNALPAEVARRPSYRGGGVIELSPQSLALRENDFLFSCDRNCSDRVEVGQIGPDGSFEQLAEARVEFQPIRNRFSVFSVREGSADGGRPLANAIPFVETDHVPEDTERLLVLTHGFVVPTPGAVEHFFPQYLRRLYWTGMPVLESQRDAQGRKIYTVGFTWPSQLGPSFTGTFFFPEAEYAALQSGVPFARLLESWKPGPSGPRQIDVLAHSLGNIVTNSALTQMPPGTVATFVMHEPALAAEAFDYNYQYTQEDKDDHWGTALRLGCGKDACGVSSDSRWEQEWQDILNHRLVPDGSPNAIPLSEERWCSALDNTVPAPRPFYLHRWRQRRPDDPRGAGPTRIGNQCGGVAPLPQRGPWLGIFASNRQRTRIVNTFSAGDRIVGEVWALSQNLQKPNRDPIIGGQAEDERIVQFWARLRVHDMQGEQYLWPDGEHSDLVRQWQELAYWFPALSRAAGRQGVPGLENRDFTLLIKDLPASLRTPIARGGHRVSD